MGLPHGNLEAICGIKKSKYELTSLVFVVKRLRNLAENLIPKIIIKNIILIFTQIDFLCMSLLCLRNISF